MTQADPGSVSAPRLAIGLIGALVAGGAFVALTAKTGTTYHFFPLLIGFLPGGLPRVLGERPLSAREGTIATVLGIAVIGAVWLVLVMLDEMPTATFISNQPGGVGGELALFGILGALIGGWWAARAV
jgi:hypothetical protein